MKQAFLAGKNLHECTEIKDAHHLSVVGLPCLGNCADALDPVESLLHGLGIIGSNVHDTLGKIGAGDRNFFDIDNGTGFLLNLLDGLASLADNGTDKLGGDAYLLDAGNERFVIFAGFGDGLEHLAHDVHASLTGLLQRLGKDLIAEAVDLDVHLGSGDTVGCTGYLEVHVAEMILVSKNVGKDGITLVGALSVGDKSHCNTCHGLLDLHTGVHQREAAAAHRSHRGRTVRLENIGNYADCVRIFGSEGNHGLESAHGEIAVADFTASGSTDGLGLTGSERREVVVQHELLVFLDQDFVHLLHIEFGAQGDGRKRLGLTAGENG